MNTGEHFQMVKDQMAAKRGNHCVSIAGPQEPTRSER